MPTLQPAQNLQEFCDEVFELSKDVWAVQTQSKGKEQAEVTETEFLALDHLSKASHPLTVGEIQRKIGVLPAQMSRIIRSLESKGEGPLIACAINLTDKRKIDVQLTAEGTRAHQAYREMKLGTIQRILLSLTDRDREEFMRIMRLIRSAMLKSRS